MKLTIRDKVADAITQSGLYAYPEFVDIFTAVFTNTATKEQADRAEELIAGGMNRKKLAKYFDEINGPAPNQNQQLKGEVK